jgi:5-methyltetrahydrofolate--homocysteine methyltransferase
MEELEPLALGGNCGNGPAEIEGVVAAMHAADPDTILVAKSNAGIPEYVEGVLTYSGTPEVMARHAVRARNLGAKIIGACCGSTAQHIRVMAEALASEEMVPVSVEDLPERAASKTQRERRTRRRGRRR